jgi:hypothetical protein
MVSCSAAANTLPVAARRREGWYARAMSEALPLPIAGRYELVSLLGQGSFGRTYLARDLAEGGRKVAVKQLRTTDVEAWKQVELFDREAAALRSLRHQGIPEIFDHLRVAHDRGEDAYLVMEYIEGTSLAQTIAQHEHLDPERLLELLYGLLDILDYLHERVPPVLHRDIKPANVLVRPGGAVVLVDFGAVRTVFRGADEGGSTIVGTHGYMPFEQYMGHASPASDLYAVGATILHLATGRPPSEFVGPDGHLRVPDELPGGPVLRAVLARMVAHAPGDRYASAREVRRALLGQVVGAMVPGAAATSRALAPVVPDAAMLRRLAPGAMRGFYGLDPHKPLRFGHILLFILLSLMSAGIVPMVFVGTSRSRRARVARFLRDGKPAEARVLQVERGFDSVVVTYEFLVDGVLRRGGETNPRPSPRRMQPGDRISILYIADEEYDSVIVGTQ